MQHFVTRTSAAQAEALNQLIESHGGPTAVRIHQITHNLDGLWVNIHLTAGDGDWIVSIDRAGRVEETQ